MLVIFSDEEGVVKLELLELLFFCQYIKPTTNTIPIIGPGGI